MRDDPFRMNKFQLIAIIEEDFDKNDGVLSNYGEACFLELERRAVSFPCKTNQSYYMICHLLDRARRYFSHRKQ